MHYIENKKRKNIIIYIKQVMASSSEKLQSISDTLIEIKKNIQNEYDGMLKKIEKYENELIELDNKFPNNSKQFREEKRKQLQNKIDSYKNDLEKWIDTQSNNAQKWFDSAMEPIKKSIEENIKSMITALTGI